MKRSLPSAMVCGRLTQSPIELEASGTRKVVGFFIKQHDLAYTTAAGTAESRPELEVLCRGALAIDVLSKLRRSDLVEVVGEIAVALPDTGGRAEAALWTVNATAVRAVLSTG